MPFTLSHPAAVLPLLRRPFSAAALVAGAVAPDMPYFARSTPVPVSAQSWYEPYLNATTSHGLLGAVTVSLPYALALWALYLVALRPVGSLLPSAAPRHPRPAGASALLRRGGWVLLSLLIGITTHLVWDSLTHSDGYVVLHVPFLGSPLAGDLTWARALQHVSTLGGLLVIAVYLWRRRSRLLSAFGSAVPRTEQPAPTVPPNRTARTALWVGLGVAAAGAVANTAEWWAGTGPRGGSGWSGSTGLPVRDMIETVLSASATGAGAALVATLLLYVAAWWTARAVGALRRRSDRSTKERAQP